MRRDFARVLSGITGGIFAAFLVASFLPASVKADSYDGITIDGSFDDWNSVVKYDIDGGNEGNNSMNQCAMVWDGDWIYLYLDEAQQNSASWSGPHYDGAFNIVTDVGEVLLISLANNGAQGNTVTVTNPKTNVTLTKDNGGIMVGFNSEYSVWQAPTLTEIAIPSSILPQYSSTINFGYYEGKNYITDVADASAIPGGTDPDDPTPTPPPSNDGSGIVIDGDYHDWDYYPVTTIEYDTAGTNNSYADAKGSIYSIDGIAKVHCVTNYFGVADTGYNEGAEFLQVTVWMGDRYSMLIAVGIDGAGNLDWSTSEAPSQSKGTHKYALFYFADSRASTNINNISSGDHLVGEMYVTVGDNQNESEFWFDVGALAEATGVSKSDAQRIQVQFHRIGKRKLEASGVSTGPVIGIVLSTAVTGSYITLKRRKRRE